MKTPLSERSASAAEPETDDEDTTGDDAPSVPDEEPDGEPDPAFD